MVGYCKRYLTKAKEADTSFIEISLDFYDDRKDDSYMPESEEESDYEDLTELDDFDLEMSLVLQDDQNFDILEIQGSLEEHSFIEGESDVCDSEQEEEEVDEDKAEDRNLVKEKKVICFENNILELAKMSPILKCTVRDCLSPITLKQSLRGTGMQLKWVCGQGHLVHQWLSQPTVKRRLAGDFLLSTAILTSGNNYEKIKLLFRFFGMGITSRTTHYQIQGKHCVPVIAETFKEMVERNRQKYTEKEIVVAGDGRMDSPGHSAQYCTYTLLEYQSKDIVSMEIIDKRMTGLKSTSMEKEGLKRAIASVIENGITVGELVTDASTTISAWLRKDYPEVSHSFDTWHGAKNFGKRIGTVAAEKKNKDLRPWASDLINHFWFCSKTADGDESKFLATWRGILHHVVDIHQWGLGDGVGGAQCSHGELDKEAEAKWLEPGGDAHMSLTRVVLDSGLLHSFKHYTKFRHTGELENFHDSLLMYCAKRFAYSYPLYKARNMLAALDYQHHKDRPKLVSKKGEVRLRRVWSKRSARWAAYEVKEPKQYSYLPLLHEGILNHFLASDEPLTAKMAMSPSDPRRIKRTLADVSPPSTKKLFSEKKSRFEQEKL